MSSLQDKLLPLIENVDYSLNNGIVIALPKTKQVEKIIQHEAILPIMNGETIISPAIPAWTETVLVEEIYYEQLPSEEQITLFKKEIELESHDLWK